METGCKKIGDFLPKKNECGSYKKFGYNNPIVMKEEKFTAVDLFAGAGGWSLGLEMAGIRNSGMYDIDKSSCKTALHNFGSNVFCLDLSKEHPRKLPKGTRIVVGSPPCQGFSNEGKKDPRDPRNNLVWVFFDIVRKLNPDVWIFENVPGFKRLHNGVFYDMLIERIENTNYNYKTFLLGAENYGVPQKRKRFFAIGSNKFVPSIPEMTHGENLLASKKTVTLWEAISDLPSVGIGERIGKFNYDSKPANAYQAWVREKSDAVYNHTTQKHSERVLEKIRTVPNGKGMCQLVGRYDENKTHYCGGYRRAVKDKPSYTVYWTRGMTSIHPEQDRFLSPRECARLQSFPDRFVFKGATIENYTQIGNAVPPLVAKAFGESVIRSLENLS